MPEVDDTRGSTTSTLLSCISLFSAIDGTTTATLGSMLVVPSDMPGFSHFPTGVADTMAIAAVEPEVHKMNDSTASSVTQTFLHCMKSS